MKNINKYSIVILLIIVVVAGTIVRFINLGGKSLWYDESLTWQESKLRFSQMLNAVNSWEGQPFLFPFLTSFISKINDSEFFLRLLPFIFGILSIVAIYFFAKEFMSRQAAIIGSLLISFSSLQVEKSQELRCYALVTLLSILVTYCYTKYIKTKNDSFLYVFLIALISSLFTHYAFFIFFIVFNIHFFYLVMTGKLTKSDMKKWAFVQFITILGIAILWHTNLKFQVARFTTSHATSISFLNEGYPAGKSLIDYGKFIAINTWKIFNYFYAQNNAFAILLFFFFSVGFIALSRKKENRIIVLVCILVFFVNIILAILDKYPYIAHRHCIHLSPFYYLFVAAGFDVAFFTKAETGLNRSLLWIVIAFVVLIGQRNVYAYLTSPGITQTREVLLYVSTHAKSDERIYVYPAVGYIFPYYYKGNLRICRFGRLWDNSEQEAIVIAHEIHYLLNDANRAWLISMMQDYIAVTLGVLSTRWTIDQTISNKAGDVKLYHITRK